MPAALTLFLALACNNKDGEECAEVFYADTDGDGHGDPNNTVTGCGGPLDGFTASDDDCDDANAATFLGAEEVCDGIDNDCDDATAVDEGAEKTDWFRDEDGDRFGAGNATVACDKPDQGWVPRANDCDDADAAVNPDADEMCNDVDDNCDELIDEDDPALVDGELWYTDLDGDRWGVSKTEFVACEEPKLAARRGEDCDDTTRDVSPEAPEICDGLDNDCDGLTDMDDKSVTNIPTYWVDADGDGYGNPKSTTVVGCEAPTGYAANNTDCDDGNAKLTVLTDFYRDGDGDGWGAGDPDNKCEPAIVDGHIEVANNADCDDANWEISPDAVELCAEGDENCNELESEADPALVPDVWYLDDDGDGWGVGTTIDSCDQPAGYVSDLGDCDDADHYVYPTAPEICDGIDNDCNKIAEDGVYVDWYADLDGDGYGDPAVTVNDCYEPSGYVMDDTDCDDAVSSTYPGAAEICANGIDDNCDLVYDNCIFDIGNAGLVFEGVQLGQGIGLTIATGDFDGDTFRDDILMGSEWAEKDNGEAYIVTGPVSGTLWADEAITLTPSLPRTYFGAVIGAGDADGDAVDDVLVSPFLGSESFLFLGPTTGNRADSDSDMQITVPTPNDLEIVRDVDSADGVNDLVLVADKTYVLSGALSGPVDAPSDYTYAWTGGMAGGLPIPVMDAEDMGDANGDGFSELALGSTQATEGVIWIVEGGLAAPGLYVAQTDNLATIEASGEFASCIVTTDYDADGYVDLIADAPEVKVSKNDHIGAVYAFNGLDLVGGLTDADAETTWEAPGGAGKQMAVGDFDADGSVDLAMGNPYGEYDQGFVFVQFGPIADLGITVDDSHLLSIPGITHEWHGTSLGAVGDWTGDGGDELVIGAQALGAEGIWGANSNGGAYVVFSEEFYPAL